MNLKMILESTELVNEMVLDIETLNNQIENIKKHLDLFYDKDEKLMRIGTKEAMISLKKLIIKETLKDAVKCL